MPAGWSIDARALVRPADAFGELAGRAASRRAWIGLRRPLFLALVMGSVVSLGATSVATARLVGPATIYWAFVPLVEILALLPLVWRRRKAAGLPRLIDAFFAGHAAWTAYLLMFGAVFAMAPPERWWAILTRPALIGLVIVIVWSLRVDVSYFRIMTGATAGGGLRQALLHRAICWPVVFWIFAVPSATPLGVGREIVDAIVEVLK